MFTSNLGAGSVSCLPRNSPSRGTRAAIESLHGIPEEAKIAIYNVLSQELEAITSAKNEEIAKINAETERLNATVAQKEMGLANIGSVIGAIVVVLVLFVLFINLK
ncbi:TPA: hypothetical protein N3322_002385 [Klebsiella pneumoniae]|jgi:hypothetical protein|uniref:hypothetical protein n=1 Tax=Klebsiella TaxID=570 RepID=UPI0011517BEC|nr:hypothetical protein [Klebsiella pneumoniae]EKV8606986.1 hypothetical protein [Klebsiella pneumoniae]MBE0162333.1 hypothetical protein [Klebsiella pneumoniae]MBK1598730.1 hypothetical protein [Klebsiella pneumoniae]MEE2192822.1 hypothetical protein [Klebsiella pneumoniae]HBQ2174598.1 hypothetical protein [Klebsiella pneumoniae]